MIIDHLKPLHSTIPILYFIVQIFLSPFLVIQIYFFISSYLYLTWIPFLLFTSFIKLFQPVSPPLVPQNLFKSLFHFVLFNLLLNLWTWNFPFPSFTIWKEKSLTLFLSPQMLPVLSIFNIFCLMVNATIISA